MQEISRFQELDGFINGTHPLALAARANVADTPNYWQAMNCADAELFERAMLEEMKALEDLKAW